MVHTEFEEAAGGTSVLGRSCPAPEVPPLEVIARLAAALHAAGAPVHRLEDTVARVSHALGCQTTIFAQPTSLMVEVDGRVRLLRVEPHEVALDELVAIDGLARDLAEGRVDGAGAMRRLAEIEAAPPPFRPLVQAAAWAGAGGSAAVFFHGGAVELVLSAAGSAAIGGLVLSGLGGAAVGRLLALLGALGVGLGAAAAASRLPVQVDVVVLSGLIVLLPGFTLTQGLTELATRHLAAGTARLAAAGTSFLQLGVGVALARALAARLLPSPAGGLPGPPVAASLATDPVSLLAVVGLAALSFLVLFRARGRDLPAIAAVSLLAVQGSRTGAELLGPDAGTFLAALLVAGAANLHARLRQVPASLLLVPGIILLVPGSLGFRGVQALVSAGGAAPLSGDSLLDGARMFVIGAALAAGVVVAGVLVPPRSTL